MHVCGFVSGAGAINTFTCSRKSTQRTQLICFLYGIYYNIFKSIHLILLKTISNIYVFNIVCIVLLVYVPISYVCKQTNTLTYTNESSYQIKINANEWKVKWFKKPLAYRQCLQHAHDIALETNYILIHFTLFLYAGITNKSIRENILLKTELPIFWTVHFENAQRLFQWTISDGASYIPISLAYKFAVAERVRNIIGCPINLGLKGSCSDQYRLVSWFQSE